MNPDGDRFALYTQPARLNPTPLPPALCPPANPDDLPAWLAWLNSQRLAPLAHKRLAGESLPAAARVHLTATYAESRAQWLQRHHESGRLLAILAQPPAIPAILLKGMALAATLYDDPALRPMNDVDLLLPGQHITEASRRLRQQGYLSGPNLAPGDDAGASHHRIFLAPREGARLSFELHTTLPRLPHGEEAAFLDWVWGGSRPLAGEWEGARAPSPTVLLLHAAMHAMQEHGAAWAPYIWFYDIDLLWRRQADAIAWSSARQWSRRLGWEAALQGGIERARELFDTPLPHEVGAWLQEDATALAGYDIVQRLRDPAVPRAIHRFDALRAGSGRQRLRMIARTLFPQPSYVRWRYRLPHPALVPLGYLYRWLDIAGDLLKSALRLFRGRR